METIQIATLIIVASLFVLEGLKIASAIHNSNVQKREHFDMERLVEMLEDGEVQATKTEIELPKKKG